MIVLEGWYFFKPILCRIEIIFLMNVLIIQVILFITKIIIFKFLLFHSILSYFLNFFEFLCAVAMVIHFHIRKENIKSHIKTEKNLKKFELFRFIYFTYALYLFIISVNVLLHHMVRDI